MSKAAELASLIGNINAGGGGVKEQRQQLTQVADMIPLIDGEVRSPVVDGEITMLNNLLIPQMVLDFHIN